MKMWRLCFLILICSGLGVVFGLSGCGDNPCDDGKCDDTEFAVDCLVVKDDDYACLCCSADGGVLCDSEGIVLPDPPPSDLDRLETQWDENSKTCVIAD